MACVFKSTSELAALELSVMVPAPALCEMTPTSEIGPLEVRDKVPLPSVEVLSTRLPALVRLTLLLPLLFSEMLPVKLLPVLPKVMRPALALKLAVPAEEAWVIVVEAACVMPTAFTFKVPEPTLTLPRIRAPLFVRLTLLAPVSVSDTAPVKVLF